MTDNMKDSNSNSDGNSDRDRDQNQNMIPLACNDPKFDKLN